MAADEDFSRLCWRYAKNGLREFAAPRSNKSRQPDNFAGAHCERHTFGYRPSHEIAHLKHRRAEWGRDLWKQVLDASADHELNKFRGRCVCDAPHANLRAVAQHRDSVGKGEYLVKPMADVDDANASRLEATYDLKQPLDVIFR